MKNLFLLITFFFTLVLVHAQDAEIAYWQKIFDFNSITRYWVQEAPPQQHWNAFEFDDNDWPTTKCIIGYGGFIQDLIECCNHPKLNLPQTSTFYLRKKFLLSDTNCIQELMLSIDYEDGFVAYLNGVEVARANLGNPNVVVGFDYLADSTYHNQSDLYPYRSDMDANYFEGFFPVGTFIEKKVLKNLLRKGNNVLAIEVHNDAYVPEAHGVVVNLFAGISCDRASRPKMDYRFPLNAETDSSNLPIVQIEMPAGGIIPNEPKVNLRMKIIDNDQYPYNFLTDPASFYGNIGIELRGSTSKFFYPKKSYTVETRDSVGENLNVELLGLPAENDWVLYGPFGDKTLIRNALAYKLYRDMGQYAPRTRFVEVFRNQDSYGVYLLTEKIKRDKGRIDIAKLNPDENSGNDLTGGYIFKIDKLEGNYGGWTSEYGSVRGNDHITYQYVYPKYDEITAEQKQYLKDFYHHFEETMQSSHFNDTVTGYPSLIDVESFIAQMIINEVSRNIDGYRLSTFFYKDRDDRDPKLHMGPIWDFNLAFGNWDYVDANKSYGWSVDFPLYAPANDQYATVPFWWKRLLQDSSFTYQLKVRYNELRQTHLHLDSIFEDIDSLAHYIEEARIRNYFIWQDVFNQPVYPNLTPFASDYQSEINYLKSWISNRLDWLDGQWKNPETLSDKLKSTSSIIVYPNPITTSAIIKAPYQSMIQRIELVDLTGKVVRFINQVNSSQVTLERSGLNSGVYILKIHADRIYTSKVIIQ